MHANANRALALGFFLLVAAPHIAMAQAGDMRARCARVGNDDRLRPLETSLIPQAKRAFELGPEMSRALVVATTSMRCMGGQVWLCNAGANLACGKAGVSRASAGADRFCKANPNSSDVPMAATGHATIYAWKCVGTKARVDRSFARVDARGFIVDNWKKLAP